MFKKDSPSTPPKKPRLYFKFSKDDEGGVFFVEYDEFNHKREFNKTDEYSQVTFELNEVGYFGGTDNEYVFGTCTINETDFKLKKFCQSLEIDEDDPEPEDLRFTFIFKCETKEQSDKEFTINYFAGDRVGYLDCDIRIFCILGKAKFSEFTGKVSKKEIGSINVVLKLGSTNNIYENVRYDGNSQFRVLQKDQKFDNPEEDFKKLPENFNRGPYYTIGRGFEINWTNSYRLSKFRCY